MLAVKGTVEYFYDDTFTDPVDLRELLRGTSDPADAARLQVIVSDFGGSYFPIKDYWKTEFHAEVKLNPGESVYRWTK